jgi:hypothetical protein
LTHRLRPYAVILGGFAGVLAAIDVRLAAVLGLGALAVLMAAAFGAEKMSDIAWYVAAALAPMNGLRVTSFAALTDVALVVAVSATIVNAIAARRPVSLRPADNGVLGGLMLIVIAGMVGTIFAGNPLQSLVVMSKFLVAAVGSLVAISLWEVTATKLRRFCWAWLAGAVANVLWAASGHGAKNAGRPLGLTTHPNHFGLVCVLGFGMALGLAASATGRERVVAHAAVATLLGGVLLSGSRAAVLGALVVIPAWSILASRWTLALRCIAGGALLAILIGAGAIHLPANSGAQRLLGGASSSASDAERVQAFEAALHRFERHPLTGEGFEFAQEAHNIYLQALVIGGPLALLGLGIAATSIARPGLRVAAALRRGSVDRRLLLPLGMLAGYAGYLVGGLFQNILWDRYLWLYIAAALGLFSIVAEHDDSSTSLQRLRLLGRR